MAGEGDVRGKWGHAWQGGPCVAGGGHLWWEACMQETWPLKWAVRNLLEFILVFCMFVSCSYTLQTTDSLPVSCIS